MSKIGPIDREPKRPAGEPKKPTGKFTKGAPSDATDVSTSMQETFQAPNLEKLRKGYSNIVDNNKAKKFTAAKGNPKDPINEKMKNASGDVI